MITAIASAYAAAANYGQAEPHLSWRQAWERLREDWQSGARPRIEDLPQYLSEVQPDDLQLASCDLVALHLQFTWQAGCGSALADYGDRLGRELPWLTEPASLPADLVEDEFVVRSTPPHGDQPALADYAARYPQRADVMRKLADRCLSDERYIKLRVLGTGHLGVVHQAYDRRGQRLVAIKEVVSHPADEDLVRLLLQEAKLTAELDHASIVSTYDVGQSRQGAFYVMELIEGQTLAEEIRDYHAERACRTGGENRRRLDNLLRGVVQMAEAVAHAHEHGVLHRDIKSGNVIVNPSGKATLIDWGLARRMGPGDPGSSSATSPHALVGTPQYMAPEQVDGREEPASDVFSLGAVLYEVLTCRPPYDWPADHLPDEWQAVIRQASLAPLIRQARIAPALKSILTKSLARSPVERYRTAREFSAELQSHLNGGGKRRGWFWLF